MIYYESYLCHSGTAGMRWHRRRYQNYDGSLTPLGRTHYGYGPARKKTAEQPSKSTFDGDRVSEKVAKSEVPSAGSKGQSSISKRISSFKKSLKAKKVEKIIRSGSSELVKKKQTLLTNSQMSKAIERVKQKRQLLDFELSKRKADKKAAKAARKAALQEKREEFKARNEERKKQREAAQEAKRAKEAENIIRTGNAKLIEQNKKKLTNDEYRRAVERVHIEQSFQEAKKKSVDWKKVADNAQQINNTLTNMVGIYNTVAAVRNTARTDATKWQTVNIKKDDKNNSNSNNNNNNNKDYANVSEKLDTIIDMYRTGLEGTESKKHKHDRRKK